MVFCALLLTLTSSPAWGVCRPENRVGGSPVFSSDFASQESAKPIGTPSENGGCGYDFASGVHKYLYGADNPVDNSDPSGNDFEALDVGSALAGFDAFHFNLSTTSLLGGGLPVKTVGDTEIDGQLNFVYSKIRLWEKQSGFGPVPKETWGQFKRMMASPTVDTIWKGTSQNGFLFQYNGTEHPRLLNRTFINSDINYIGFGEGYCARGILGMHEAIREHLWVDYNSSYFFGIPVGIGKRPSANTFAAADTGYDWAEDKFWPSSGPRHGSGN